MNMFPVDLIYENKTNILNNVCNLRNELELLLFYGINEIVFPMKTVAFEYFRIFRDV